VGQPKRIENARILIANTPMDTDKIKIYGSRVGGGVGCDDDDDDDDLDDLDDDVDLSSCTASSIFHD